MKTSELLDLQTFIAADYKAIEIRILAEYANDKLLIKQLNTDLDIHCLVGNMLTGRSYEEIDKDRDVRTGVKGFHFSIVYGTTLENLLANLVASGVKITLPTLRGYHRKYFSTYTGVADFMERMPRQVEEMGYVDSLFGFRRDIYQNDPTRHTHWANQALNSPIQSSAHQLMLMALAILDQKPKTYNRLQKPVMEIHDSFWFFTPLRYLQETNQQIKRLLEQDVPEYAAKHFGKRLRVPLIAETKAGFCMGSMVEYDSSLETEAFLSAWRNKHRETEAVASWDKLIPGFSKNRL